MARVLFFTDPVGIGHVYPLVSTLEELKRRGHDVLAKTSERGVRLLTEAGIAAEPVDPELESVEVGDWRSRTSLGALRNLLDTYNARSPLEVKELDDVCRRFDPEAMVIDSVCFGASAAVQARGALWAQYATYPLPIPSRDVPAFGPGLRPARGALARGRDRLIRRVTARVYNSALPTHNAFRRQLGLNALEDGLDVYLQAPLMLAFTAEPFEYPRSDWPASVRLVGPGVSQSDADPPEWIDEITDPVVLVTVSTVFQDDGKLIQAVLDAAAGERMFVVATTAALDPESFVAPANARVQRFAPHDPIIRRAACVVCHGGMGTTQRALAAGVPVCAVPFCRDQPEVARRVEVSEGGTRLSRRRLTRSRMRSAIERTIALRPGAKRIASAFSQVGPTAAADVLEENLLAESPHSRQNSRRFSASPLL